MKLLVLVSRFPYPLNKGDRLRAFHQIEELSQDFDISLCCVTDETVSQEAIAELEPYCSKIKILKLSRPKIYLHLLQSVFSNRPLQYHYFFQKGIQKEVDAFVQAVKPDHIYCQLIRTAQYALKYTDIPKTLDYSDALSAGMLRRRERSSFPTQVVLGIESKRLANYESYLFDRFDIKTIIANQDKELINHPDRESILIVPNGVSDSFFEESDEPKTNDLLFTGNMNYYPNVDAVWFIAKRVLPLLHKKRPDLRLLISGANPNRRVKSLASDRITVGGWVDDIRSSYRSSRIFLAPMFLGSGMQNKILEAMASGLPCLTTPLANNAIGASDGEEIMIGETAEDFARLVEQLLDDKDLRSRLSAKGKEYARQSFSWNASSAILSNAIKARSKVGKNGSVSVSKQESVES